MQPDNFFLDLILSITDFIPLVAFLAPNLGGELAILLLAFGSAQGLYSLWTVIIFVFFGMMAADTFWFFAMRSPWAERAKRWGKIAGPYSRIEAKIASFSERSDVVILLISKMLIGTRIFIIAYISVRNISYGRFMLYNGIAAFIWAVILGYLGWFAGRGYYNLAESYDFLVGAGFAVLFIGAFYLSLILLKRWLEKKQ